MSSLKQILAVTGMSLLGIPQRAGACLVILVGIAGTVGVVVSVFAMVHGFSELAARTGRTDRAIVLAKGAETEANSGLSRDDVATILNAGSIRTDGEGRPIASVEALASVRLTDRRSGLDAFATVRGVSGQVLTLRPEIRLLEGRMFEPGLNELIVGQALQRRLQGLDIGSRISLPQADWTIVGVFASGADLRESELLGDVSTIQSAYRRNVFNSVTVSLQDARSFATFRTLLEGNPSLAVRTERERDYLSAASQPTRQVLRFVAFFIGGIMVLGASFAAINAMYSSISSRALEIAVLRAIGFGATPVIISVLLEAMLWAFIGALVGAGLASRLLSGNAVTTLSSAAPAPVSFTLDVDLALVGIGIATACTIGLLGGLFPAIRLAHAPVAPALCST